MNTNRVTVNYSDHTVFAEIAPDGLKAKVKPNRYYYWFNSNDIKRTKGGFDGKLLNGLYRDFYINKNLKERGFFKNGLKVGTWIGWYLNGEYHLITHWKDGMCQGIFQEFDENGKLLKEGKYKNGALNGKVKVFHLQNSVQVVKYRNGAILAKKDKHQDGDQVNKKKKTKQKQNEEQKKSSQPEKKANLKKEEKLRPYKPLSGASAEKMSQSAVQENKQELSISDKVLTKKLRAKVQNFFIKKKTSY